MLYGEVGTGKSMLIDLLANSLPTGKKRRWHFNTFMLEIFAKLEQIRRSRLKHSSVFTGQDEHSLLSLARDMISTSPILFLDEFQLPDRAASKILSSLFTSFFHLGGVLIATSNRMPEELAKASGVEFTAPPSHTEGFLRHPLGLFGAVRQVGMSENMFGGKGDSAAFLDVLRARCEIWNMEGMKDWRRQGLEKDGRRISGSEELDESEVSFEGLEPTALGNWGLGYEQSLPLPRQERNATNQSKDTLPRNFYVEPPLLTSAEKDLVDQDWQLVLMRVIAQVAGSSTNTINWESTSFRVYGRTLLVPRQFLGATSWTFDELCTASFGPADYITLASNFHTFVLTNVPVLTLLQKNEARRFITLLDALYEAGCKLLIRASAGPDDLFFPEAQRASTGPGSEGDNVYSETFAEIYQDQTSPFRANISSYTSSASPPSYAGSPLPSSLSPQSPATQTTRSILADEDSDFGPTYGAGRSSGSSSLRARGPADGAPGAGNEIGRQESPDFTRTGIFTGEDEKFAYKRAESRLWEMCGSRWWAREEEGWWKPLSKESRRWEGGVVGSGEAALSNGNEGAPSESRDEKLFRHGASPFRTAQEPPPKIGWTHAWGMMRWGKKAGAWGKGVEGLEDRRQEKAGNDEGNKE